MTDVTVYGGKYRCIFDKDGARALRYGAPWRDCCGDGLILALSQDLEESREQRDTLAEALRELEKAYSKEVNWEFAGRGDKNPSVTSRPALKARAALKQLENNQ